MDPELGKLRAGSGINHSGSTTLLFRHSSHCPVDDITVGHSPKSIPSFSDKFLWCRQIQNDSHRPRGLQPSHHPFHLDPIGQLLLGGAPPQNPSPANPQSRRFSVPVNQSSSTHSRPPNPLLLPPPTGHSPPSSLPPCPHPPTPSTTLHRRHQRFRRPRSVRRKSIQEFTPRIPPAVLTQQSVLQRKQFLREII